MHHSFANIAIGAIACTTPVKEIDLAAAYSHIWGKDTVHRVIKSTGIKKVRRVENGTVASDLCINSAKHLISNDLNEKIDALIFASPYGDHTLPPTSCHLQHRMQLDHEVACFDIAAGCNGFAAGVLQACVLISSGAARTVLLLLGESPSVMLNHKDIATALLFGDAGSAILIKKSTEAHPINISISNDGANHMFIQNARGFRNPNANALLKMDGSEVINFVIREVPPLVDDFLNYHKIKITDFSAFIAHQANKTIIDYLIKKLNLPKEKTPVILDNFGNTGGASIPLTITETFQNQNLNQTLCMGFGLGLSCGITSLNLKKTKIHPTLKL